MSLYYHEFPEAISASTIRDSVLFVFFFLKHSCIQLRKSLRKAVDLHWRWNWPSEWKV